MRVCAPLDFPLFISGVRIAEPTARMGVLCVCVSWCERRNVNR